MNYVIFPHFLLLSLIALFTELYLNSVTYYPRIYYTFITLWYLDWKFRKLPLHHFLKIIFKFFIIFLYLRSNDVIPIFYCKIISITLILVFKKWFTGVFKKCELIGGIFQSKSEICNTRKVAIIFLLYWSFFCFNIFLKPHECEIKRLWRIIFSVRFLFSERFYQKWFKISHGMEIVREINLMSDKFWLLLDSNLLLCDIFSILSSHYKN